MNRPLRIAHAAPPLERVPPLGYGGTERVIHELVRELVARGHEVTTFASADSDVPGRLVPTVDEALRPAGFGGDPSPWYLSTILSVVERAREFDVIHSHLEWYSTILSKVSPVPVVTTFHGRLDYPWAHDLLIRGEGNYVAISQAHAGTHPDVPWAGVVHNGLDLARAPFERRRGEGLCFVGRVAPEKGIVDAIEIARLSRRPLRIAAKIGTTPQERAYHEDVFLPALATAGDDVEFLGEVSGADRDRLFAESYATLMPGSWPEPFGLVAIESLACGTPLIARPAGALPEIVRPGRDGFFGDDVTRMAFFVDRVADLDRAEIRASVIERFSAARMADRYEAIYERLIDERRPAAATAALARAARGAMRFDTTSGVDRNWTPRRAVSRRPRREPA
ncbi:MAG: glycosyltransferase family 4 protein, partial [Chloroflexota bacterium]|nr:glycosyltransferase family 4 protein [Chloroflexota bacterium]